MAGPNPAHPFTRAFLDEMRDRGYVEGQNFILERRSLEGKAERGSEVVAELVRLKVEVIVVTVNSTVRDAKRVTTAVPIVMAGSSAPVEAGLVASLARPGGTSQDSRPTPARSWRPNGCRSSRRCILAAPEWPMSALRRTGRANGA